MFWCRGTSTSQETLSSLSLCFFVPFVCLLLPLLLLLLMLGCWLIRVKREDDYTKGIMLKFACEVMERHPELYVVLKKVIPPPTACSLLAPCDGRGRVVVVPVVV